MAARSLQTLVAGLIDYAGLYPPAKLPMDQAVDNYGAYLRSPQAWMLGRFICPASKLEEFRREARGNLPHTAIPQPATATHNGKRGGGATSATPHPLHPAPGTGPSLEPWEEPWRLSVIIDGDLDENLDAVFAFNHEHEKAPSGLASIDAIEIKAGAPGEVDAALDLIPEEIYPFFEIALTGDVRGMVAALAGTDAAAKIRTGGVTPDVFPACEAVAKFLEAAAAADVPFKATAGLHHPVRGEYNLTYEPKCPRGVMHGFVNVFLAAAMVREGRGDADHALEVLRETDGGRMRFTDEAASWRNRQVATGDIEAARAEFALSYGSCSFEEPVEDLKRLGWL